MAQRPRTTELLLLLAAAPLVLLVFALVDGATREVLTSRDFLVPGGLLLAFLLAHLVVRWRAPDADPVLLPIVALLTGIGLAVVTRLDAALGASQVGWVFAGVGVLVATLLLVPSLERVARYKYTIALVGLSLLLAPAVIGTEVNGAKLWLRFAGMSFQPSEVAKVLIVVFLAAYLAENREVLTISTKRFAGVWLPSARHMGPLLAMWAVSLVVLVSEKDLGSSLLFYGIFLTMLYVATGRPGFVLIGLGLFVVGATGAYFAFDHVQTRVAIWIDPFADVAGRGYQLVQSLFALAAGGMAGTGLTRGLPGRIPFVETDFIFSAIGEELGLLGGVAILLAYLVFCYRGLAVASRSRSAMASLTSVGLVAALGFQTFVIVGGVTRLIPLTGITLPFVSYGGSSIVANFMLLGLLLRASNDAVRTEDAPALAAHGRLSSAVAGRRLGWVAIVLSALFVALIVNLTNIQVVQRAALNANPANTRTYAAELAQPRGRIVTSDGVVLAESVRHGSLYRRVYPRGSLAANIVGYASARYGRSGMEAAMNETLVGRRAFATPADVVEAAAGLSVPGRDVVLTIDSRVQKSAESALGSKRGACVVIDPRTGAVLALATNPRFNSNDIDATWEKLSNAAASPLLDRTRQTLYPPGSTFKVVTLTGALAGGIATPESTYPGPSTLEIGGGKVTNFESSGYGKITVLKATTSSVNTVYAQLGVALGAEALVKQAEAFGLGKTPPLELPVKQSIMTDPKNMSVWETAWAAVGQPVGEREQGAVGPAVTPLQMALIAAGIAADGEVMKPYLVQRVEDPTGRVLARTRAGSWTRATDAATASTVTEIMTDVVKRGSGARAQIPDVAVAGKTGTAEVSKNAQTNAWFIAFAPADLPRVAMAITLEEAGVGGRVAAPAAKGVLQRALQVTK